jgi:hypothetical protein
MELEITALWNLSATGHAAGGKFGYGFEVSVGCKSDTSVTCCAEFDERELCH